MSPAGPAFWRVFPWDEKAVPGSLHSPSFLPAPTGRGRFDLPRQTSFVLYLAESPDHAVGEALQAWRGRTLSSAELRRAGLPLLLVSVSLGDTARDGLADLCDPHVLAQLNIAPDHLASRERSLTQPLAAAVWEAGHAGLRWWSSFWGDWHTVALYISRAASLSFGEPEALTLESPAVVTAARLLGIQPA